MSKSSFEYGCQLDRPLKRKRVKYGTGRNEDVLFVFDFEEPEEEIRDDQKEIDKLIEETRDQLLAESLEKERSVSATSQEDSVEALFKELNISVQEGETY